MDKIIHELKGNGTSPLILARILVDTQHLEDAWGETRIPGVKRGYLEVNNHAYFWNNSCFAHFRYYISLQMTQAFWEMTVTIRDVTD